jgi:hypothetical protein
VTTEFLCGTKDKIFDPKAAKQPTAVRYAQK